jgi:hypothetical protein
MGRDPLRGDPLANCGFVHSTEKLKLGMPGWVATRTNPVDVTWPGYSGWHCVDCGRVDGMGWE